MLHESQAETVVGLRQWLELGVCTPAQPRPLERWRVYVGTLTLLDALFTTSLARHPPCPPSRNPSDGYAHSSRTQLAVLRRVCVYLVQRVEGAEHEPFRRQPELLARRRRPAQLQRRVGVQVAVVGGEQRVREVHQSLRVVAGPIQRRGHGVRRHVLDPANHPL
jgi:hypothetical protein